MVGVARVVAELACRDTNGGRARAVGTGREGGRVLGVAGASRAAGGHGREVAQAAAHHIHIGLAKGGAGFTECEGECLCAGERATAHACDHDGGRGGVGLVVAVVGDEVDRVVGVCTISIGVQCRITECVVGHVHAARTLAAGCGGEGGGVLGRTHLHPVGECAATGLHIALHKVAGGLGQHKAQLRRLAGRECGFVGRDRDGGGGGVGCGRVGAGVVGQHHLVVVLLRGSCGGGADVGVRVGIARRIGERAGFDANGGAAAGVGRRREGGRVLGVAARCAAAGGHRRKV